MATIRKKIWPQFFEKIKTGEVRFELRLADVEVKPGDILVLEEWDPEKKKYTGRKIEKKVKSVMAFPPLVTFWAVEDGISKHGIYVIELAD